MHSEENKKNGTVKLVEYSNTICLQIWDVEFQPGRRGDGGLKGTAFIEHEILSTVSIGLCPQVPGNIWSLALLVTQNS